MAALVVWVPKRGGQEKDVAEATATFPDPRAQHFWDGQGWALQHFKPVLGIQVDAWDLYLLYGPDARWDGAAPPRPDFWMHQLNGVDNGPLLDPDVFGQHIAQALGGPSLPRR
ncbi:MAG TPA: hypothetical protein VKB80_04865 [Kofleriaceae bacterium]|nr:hypothetical protein [Kofleriaceae bacterium]